MRKNNRRRRGEEREGIEWEIQREVFLQYRICSEADLTK